VEKPLVSGHLEDRQNSEKYSNIIMDVGKGALKARSVRNSLKICTVAVIVLTEMKLPRELLPVD
jgi:hypothetical protein